MRSTLRDVGSIPDSQTFTISLESTAGNAYACAQGINFPDLRGFDPFNPDSLGLVDYPSYDMDDFSARVTYPPNGGSILFQLFLSPDASSRLAQLCSVSKAQCGIELILDCDATMNIELRLSNSERSYLCKSLVFDRSGEQYVTCPKAKGTMRTEIVCESISQLTPVLLLSLVQSRS